MEDMEICFRANKLGFVTYFYPNVKLKHKSLGSSNRTFAIINIYKGILYFYSKHKTHLEYLVVCFYNFSSCIYSSLSQNSNYRYKKYMGIYSGGRLRCHTHYSCLD